jgi:hypothetical protein
LRTPAQLFVLLSILLILVFSVAPSIESSLAINESQGAAVTGPQYGSITGRVMGEDGPLPYAAVTVSPVGNRARGNASRNVTADDEGNFKIDGLRPIAWRVTATAPGYVSDASLDGDTKSSYHRTGDSVTIQMVKGGVITGRVLNSLGEPLIAVRVNAQIVRDAQGNAVPGGSPAGDFQTDDRGIYRIFGLRAGTYIVVAGSSSGFQNPRPGIRSGPYDGDVPVYHPSSTRDAAAEVTVNYGVETGGIDIQYRSEKGHAISGRVSGPASENSRPGGFISVTLAHQATGTVFHQAFVMQRGPGFLNNNSGNNAFAIYGVPDGEYEVTAYRNSPDGNDAASLPRRVTVAGRDLTGIDLLLKPLASIYGRLQLESANGCPSNRKPSFEEQVFTLHPEKVNEQRASGNLPHSSVPDRDGELMFRELNAGHYRIVPQLFDAKWFIRSITVPAAPAGKPAIKASSIDVGRHGLSLKPGERMTRVTITVAEGAAAIKGKVNASAGLKLPSQVVVHLIPVERQKADDVLRYAETKTSGDYEFNLTSLEPGKYWIIALPSLKNDDKPKAWNVTERLRLRKEAEAINTLIELQPCQQIGSYELPYKSTAVN